MLLIYIFLLIGIHLIHVPVKGVLLSFTESRVVNGTGQTVLTCAVDESGVASVLVMQLKISLGNTVVNLGALTSSGLTQTIPAGLADRMALAGSIDSTTPTNSRMTLTIDKDKVRCSDGTKYQCSLTYLTNSPTNPEPVTVHQNASLEVYVYPSMISLIGRVNGRVEYESRETNKAPAKVGDVLELACTANIGSVSSNNIQWRRTSELTTNEYWKEYQPTIGSSVVTDPIKDGCGFLKTDTITYNLTVSDANRKNNLGFECYVKADGAPYDGRETEYNPKYYVEVGKIEICPTPSSGSDGDVESQAALIGGVVGAVAGLIVVVFSVVIIFKRKSVQSTVSDNRQTGEHEVESPNFIYDELNNISSGSTYSPLEQVTQSPAFVEYENKIFGKDSYVNSPTSQYEQLNSMSSLGSTYLSIQPALQLSKSEDNKIFENDSYINPI